MLLLERNKNKYNVKVWSKINLPHCRPINLMVLFCFHLIWSAMEILIININWHRFDVTSPLHLPASQYGNPSSKKNGLFPNSLPQYAQVKHSGWKCFPIAFRQSSFIFFAHLSQFGAINFSKQNSQYSLCPSSSTNPATERFGCLHVFESTADAINPITNTYQYQLTAFDIEHCCRWSALDTKFFPGQ